MKQESLPRDRELKAVTWTGTITTNDSSTYYNTFGLYRGTVDINTLTGYDATIWAKRLFCFVSSVYDSGDGSIAYSANAGSSRIGVTTPKPSRTVNVALTVCYYE